MSDLLTIGSSGVNAYQRALATISNNIANVSTDGYARQDVAIASGAPRQIGSNYFGTGARFDAVRRQYDAFVESNLRNSNSDLKSQEPLVTYINRLIDVMGDQSIGLTSAMNLFFQSARDLATDPASTVARSTFLRDSDGLAARFRQLAGQFDSLDIETRQKVDTDVGQVNSLTAQLASLNKQLAKHSSAADQPSELLDQRDILLRNLSAFTAIKTKFALNGAVLVSVGDTLDQGVLVNGVTSRDIYVSQSKSDPTKLDFVIDPYGKPETVPYFASGSIGGTVNFREQVLMPALASLDDLAAVVVSEVNLIHRNGVDAQGNLGADLFGFAIGESNTAKGMRMVVQDTNRVAAAGQFRVTNDPLNSGEALARISYTTPAFAGMPALAGSLGQGNSPQVGEARVTIDLAQGVSPVGVVSAGTNNFQLTLAEGSTTQQIQVLTRDGRQLLGTNLSDSSSLLSQVMQSANGIEASATYSSVYLNKSGASAYLDMDLFVGAKADVQSAQQFDPVTGQVLTPVLRPAILVAAQPATISAANSLQGNVLTINGRSIGSSGDSFTSLAAVATAINTAAASNPSLGLTATVADGKLSVSRASNDTTNDIRLGLNLSAGASPDDLRKLGFDTTLYVSGTAKDDLLLFVTDSQSSSPGQTSTKAQLYSQFNGVQGDMKQTLRTGKLVVNFDKGIQPNPPDSSKLYFTIRDSLTGTVVAERHVDATISNPAIDYRGLRLEFSTTPKAGDMFTVDGNRDGIGNNEAMLQLVNLEDKEVMPGGLTLTEAYIERVNLVGNTARQANIAQQALQVVYKQAKETRDGISGVSLDEEATNLVRYQQAYQANAKVMQIGSQLFDAILQVRA